MKKIKKYALLSLACCCMASCDDYFDFGDDGTVSYDQIFSDYHLTGNFLNTAYNYIPNFGATSAGGTTFLGCYTDEAVDGQCRINNVSQGYYDGKSTAANNIVDNGLYNKLFEGINYCNIFLAHIDHATNMLIPQDRSKWKGEAYLLRAFYYLQLIKRYGPVPIIKEPLPVDFDYSKQERPTFYQNVKEIINDCNLALQEPELKMRVSNVDNNGAMTKSVAYAIKSQAMLFAASPLWCGDQNYWNEAYEVTKESMLKLEEAGFKVNLGSGAIPAGFTPYQNYFLLPPENSERPKNDLETIYSHKGQIGDLWSSNGLPMFADVVKAGVCPSQELVDAFETSDGVPVLNLSKPYLDADHIQPNYNSAALLENGGKYDPEHPYENRDPRLKSIVYCNEVSAAGPELPSSNKPVFTYVGGNCGFSETDTRYTCTGYYLRKWVHPDSKKSSNKDGYWRYFRMSEIYLNYAEADFYKNGRTVTPEALAAVNKVRARAGMPNFSSDISSNEFELRLRNERRIEFAFEEHRYFDVRRWKMQKDVEGIVTGMKITGSSPDYQYDRIVVSKRNVTDDKYQLWPIPRTEQIKYQMLGIHYQNEGW